MKNNYDIKLQSCNLSDALHRNINDRFESVSFKVCHNGNIKVKIVLNERTEREDEYIDDLMAEFEALQTTNNVEDAVVVTGINIPPLEHLVYRRKFS